MASWYCAASTSADKAAAYDDSSTPFLPGAQNAAWPEDSVAGDGDSKVGNAKKAGKSKGKGKKGKKAGKGKGKHKTAKKADEKCDEAVEISEDTSMCHVWGFSWSSAHTQKSYGPDRFG